MRKAGRVITTEYAPFGTMPQEWKCENVNGLHMKTFFKDLQKRCDQMGVVIGKSRSLEDKHNWATDMTAIMENGEEYTITVKHQNNWKSFVDNLKEVSHNYNPDVYAGIMRESYADIGQKINYNLCQVKALAFGEKLNDMLDATMEVSNSIKNGRETRNKNELANRAYQAYVKYINRGLQRGREASEISKQDFKKQIFANKKAMQKTMPKEIFEEYIKLVIGDVPVKRMEIESNRAFSNQFAKISPKVRKMLDEHKYVPFSNEKSGVTYNPYKAVIDYTTRFGEKFTFSFTHNNTTTSFINGFKEVARQFDPDEHVVDRCMRGGGGNMNLMTASANEIKEQFMETVRQLERYQKLAKEHKMGGNKSQRAKNSPSLKELSASL